MCRQGHSLSPETDPSSIPKPAQRTPGPLLDQCFNLLFSLSNQFHSSFILSNQSTTARESHLLSSLIDSILYQSRILVQTSIQHRHRYFQQKTSLSRPNTLSIANHYCNTFWSLLKKIPLPPSSHLHLISFISLIDEFSTKIIVQHPLYPEIKPAQKYYTPCSPSRPSVITQVYTTEITTDPYLLSLQKKYYYPLASMTTPSDSSDDSTGISSTTNTNGLIQDSNSISNNTQKETPPIITVEDSLEAIDELINDFIADIDNDADEVSSHTAPITAPTPHFTPPQKMRFSLFPKKAVRQYQSVTDALPLLKSLFKTILQTSQNTKILTIRDNNPVHPMKTTDQINALSMVGAINYFKSSRSAIKSLAGDYHISSPLSFSEFKSHQKISSWLGLNGYHIIFHECQTSDMVLIGFLSRIRPFTWREDLKRYIMETPQWKANPFHFHLYFGTLSSNLKAAMTPIMLIEVDRPKIEQGLHFFRTTMDDEQRISSNGIPYPFFSLYKNRLSDEERLQIITDSRQHTDNISIIHINGLGNIDNLITLKKQVQVQLWKLLLSIRQMNTSNHKLFIQVEKQSDPDWITAAFH
jgi:hypothetical protein